MFESIDENGLVKTWTAVKAAAVELKCKPHQIKQCLKGLRKTHHGFSFRYILR